jgi:ornithine cyclodeaminase
MTIAYYDAADVVALLDYPGCIGVMREAMIALSADPRPQPLRQIFKLDGGNQFGTMPGAVDGPAGFGCKIVSVFGTGGHSRHQGLVIGFDPVSGAVACLADAEPVTQIRTACATAAATDALARADARVLAIYGTGLQAEAHLRAVPLVRQFDEIRLWGRSPDATRARAAILSETIGREIVAVADGRAAADGADVICTVSSSPTPILHGAWVAPGTHVNLVGSSYLGPVEADNDLVAAGRYIVDYRPGALAQASELAVARDAGLVDDGHVAAEIGEVLAGRIPGRRSADEITIYKSLGHIAQDLTAAHYLHQKALAGR